MKTNLIFIITLLLAVTGMCLTYTKADEEVTETLELSTYYPAPYGEYDELYVSKWLELDRTGIDTGELRLAAPDTTGTTNTLWDFHNRGTDTGFGAIAGGDGNKLYLTYYDGTTWSDPYIVVTPSGNLGIGTTSPTSLLYLYKKDSSVKMTLETIRDSSWGNRLTFMSQRATAPGTLQNGDSIGTFEFMGWDSNSYEIGAMIDSTARNTVTDGSMPADLKFKTTPNGSITPVERMRITPSGNIGIGTWSPTAALHVFQDYNAGAVKGLLVDGSISSGAFPLDVGYNDGTHHSMVVIDDTGYVGIGTTNPEALLSLYKKDSSVKMTLETVRDTSWGNHLTFMSQRATAPGTLQNGDNIGTFEFMGWDSNSYEIGAIICSTIRNPISDGSLPSDITFKTTPEGSTTPVERMRIAPSGNVGIGTIWPDQRLQIAEGNLRVGEINPPGTGSYPGYGRRLYFSGGPAPGISYNSENSDPIWMSRYNGASDSSILVISVGDGSSSFDGVDIGTTDNSGGYSSTMSIKTNGNVGIGTTSPGGGTTAGTAVLSIANGTAPVGGVANQASLYVSAGEMYTLDSSGNATLQSPHDPETGEWIFYSKNTVTGRVVRVDMERMVKAIERVTGEKFMVEKYEESGS